MEQPKWKSWVQAMRLRTLPLAFSAIITGSFISFKNQFSWTIFFLSTMTTLLLQILSNLANDLGDGLKGTDNAQRIGPRRAIQAGLLSVNEMKMGIAVVVILCLIFGLSLLSLSLNTLFDWMVFLVLAVACLIAAITYTVGKRAYGYFGFGDLAVLFFFGFVGVGGSYFLQQHEMSGTVLLPAVSIGCFATGVLNLNNMRDQQNDALSGKITMVVRMGPLWARRYHFALISLGWIAVMVFWIVTFRSSIQGLFMLTAPLFWRHAMIVARIDEPAAFDPSLKQLALSTFLFSLLFALGAAIS
ncbi:MAG: 1,4-dihydroxy-2-naphthoate polyprenyltransferase [Chitinophagales bacterium]